MRRKETDGEAYRKSRALGKTWFESLSSCDKDAIGDALVLGDFDWMDWFVDKPSAAFLAGINEGFSLWTGPK